MHGVVHRNIKLSVYPQLFVISLGAENGANFKKSKIVSWKPIFEALYLIMIVIIIDLFQFDLWYVVHKCIKQVLND